MEIRQTTTNDIDIVMSLYNQARVFMRENGNPNQWVGGYPSRELIESDIKQGKSYVCLDEGKIVGTFYFTLGDDPTYSKIYEGAWLNDKSYGVVHRIAAGGHQKGIASFCLEWCFNQCFNIRIDTHRDNIPMQRLLQKNGYVLCGIIYLVDGSERLAYQKIE